MQYICVPYSLVPSCFFYFCILLKFVNCIRKTVTANGQPPSNCSGQKYVHVVLSLDEQLSEAYSFGRRNPYIPLIAGFEREWSRQIAGAFPTAEYRICELDCTGEQKEAIRERLHKDYKNRFRQLFIK